MSGFVQREVSELAKQPSPSDEAIILVGYASDEGNLKDFISDKNGEVLESLPYRSLRVQIPETSLEALVNHPAVETVELDSGMETLRGN